MGFRELFESDHLADITLLIEGQRIAAHKVVLFASCEYFRRMFSISAEFREGQLGMQELSLQGVSFQPFHVALRYWYTGEPPQHIGTRETLDLLTLADYFQSDDLLNITAEMLRTSLEFDAALRLLTMCKERVLLDTLGHCKGDSVWSDLWRAALTCTEEVLTVQSWPTANDLEALQELVDVDIAHLVLRSVKPKLSASSAQEVVSALCCGLDMAALVRPFKKLNCEQSEATAVVSFTKAERDSNTFPWEESHSQVLTVLGCIGVQCQVFPNGRVVESDVPGNAIWMSAKCISNDLSSDGDATFRYLQDASIYGERHQVTVRLTCGPISELKAINETRFVASRLQMQQGVAHVEFRCFASPPPLCQVLIRAHASSLLEPSASPLLPAWLPAGLVCSIVQVARTADPNRLMQAISAWSRHQSSGHESCSLLQSVLSKVQVQVSIWDYLQVLNRGSADCLEVEPVKKGPFEHFPRSLVGSGQASSTPLMSSRGTNTDPEPKDEVPAFSEGHAFHFSSVTSEGRIADTSSSEVSSSSTLQINTCLEVPTSGRYAHRLDSTPWEDCEMTRSERNHFSRRLRTIASKFASCTILPICHWPMKRKCFKQA